MLLAILVEPLWARCAAENARSGMKNSLLPERSRRGLVVLSSDLFRRSTTQDVTSSEQIEAASLSGLWSVGYALGESIGKIGLVMAQVSKRGETTGRGKSALNNVDLTTRRNTVTVTGTSRRHQP